MIEIKTNRIIAITYRIGFDLETHIIEEFITEKELDVLVNRSNYIFDEVNAVNNKIINLIVEHESDNPEFDESKIWDVKVLTTDDNFNYATENDLSFLDSECEEKANG